MSVFQHMIKFNNIYADLEMAEEFICSDQKAKILLGMKSLGSAFEKMVYEVAACQKITQLDANRVGIKANIQDKGKLVLYLKTLEFAGVLNREINNNSLDRWHRIRIFRNKATHDAEHYAGSSILEIKKDAKEMLSLMKTETEFFASKYTVYDQKYGEKLSGIFQTKKNKQVASPQQCEAILAVIIVLIILFAWFLATTLTSTNHRDQTQIEMNEETEKETYSLPKQVFENLSSSTETVTPQEIEEEIEELPFVDTENTSQVYLDAINRCGSYWYNNFNMGIGGTDIPSCVDVWGASSIEGVYTSDASVVTVDLNGVVTGVGKGSAYVVIWVGGNVADALIYHIE